MDKEQQKLKVLSMLKEDVITQEQALDLLELIAKDSKTKATGEAKEHVSESPSIVSPKQPFDFFRTDDQLFSLSKEVELTSFKGLKLVGKNSQIRVQAHHQSNIEISGWYKSSRNNPLMITLEEDNGYYFLSYNYHGIKYMGYDVKIPEEMVGNLLIENSNASVDISDIKGHDILIKTKNASIDVNRCASNSLIAVTKNSYVNVRKYQGDRLEVMTTNDKITAKEVISKEGEFQTTNASIMIQDSDIEQLSLETKNAQIWLDLASQRLCSDVKYHIEGRTTNAGVEVLLPEEESISYKIIGSTKRGQILVEEEGLVIKAKDKGYLVAQSHEYELTDRKMTFDFQTTNGDIKLKE